MQVKLDGCTLIIPKGYSVKITSDQIIVEAENYAKPDALLQAMATQQAAASGQAFMGGGIAGYQGQTNQQAMPFPKPVEYQTSGNICGNIGVNLNPNR